MSTLLPDKHSNLDHALLGQASGLARGIGHGVRVGRWWAHFHTTYPSSPYSRFLLAADVLFALGVIQLEDDVITLVVQ